MLATWLNFVILLAATLGQLPISHPNVDPEFFDIVWKKDYSLVAVYNAAVYPKHKPYMEALMTHLAQDPLMAEWNVHLVLADTGKLETVYNHYSMTELPGFYFFLRKQLVKLPSFNTTFLSALAAGSPELLLDSVQNWVHNQLNNIIVELQTLSELEDALDNHKIVGVYFGSHDQMFKKFRNFAARHLHFKFFYSFSEDLKVQAFRGRGGAPTPGATPTFAIIRHVDLWTDLDPHPVVSTTDVGDELNLSRFFDYERYPKLMGEEYGNDIMRRMYHHSDKLILFVTNPGTPKEDLAVYHQALALLPKRMIYSQIDMHSTKVVPFLQLFMVARVSVMPNRLYSLYVTPSRLVDIKAMEGGLTVHNIISFVAGVIDQHREFFGVDKRPDSRDTPIEEDL